MSGELVRADATMSFIGVLPPSANCQLCRCKAPSTIPSTSRLLGQPVYLTSLNTPVSDNAGNDFQRQQVKSAAGDHLVPCHVASGRWLT